MRNLIVSIVCLSVAATLATAGGEKGGKIEGKWKAVGAMEKGKKVPPEVIEKAMLVMTFKDGKYSVNGGGKEVEAGTYKTDASKKPATLDTTHKEGSKEVVEQGIYKIEGDTLTVAMGPQTTKGPGPRPKDFEERGNVTIFKRVK